MVATPDSQITGGDPAGESVDIPDFAPIARHYRLVLHERVVARRYYQYRYSTPELRSAPRTDNFGPVAVVLTGALYAWALPGWLLMMSGLGGLVVSGGAAYANWMVGIGIAMLIIGVLRGFPQMSAMKRYKAEQEKRSQLPSPSPSPSPGAGGPNVE